MGGGSVDEPTWRTASQCDAGECVEIGALGESVLVRSSVDPDGIRITLSRHEWREFIAGVKDGGLPKERFRQPRNTAGQGP
jgi:hypothetical protein